MFLPLLVMLLAQGEGLQVLVFSAREDVVFLVEVPADGPNSRGLLRFVFSFCFTFAEISIFQDLGLEKDKLWS